MTVPAGFPSVIDGHPQRSGVRADRVVAVDTGSKDDSADLLTAAFGAVVTRSRLHLLPGRRRARPRARAATASGSGSCTTTRTPTRARSRRCSPRPIDRPRRRHPRPQAPRVAVAAAAARARRHHLRHRPPRDRARARGVRPGPARRRPRGAGGQHRRHAGPPHRPRASSAASTSSCRSSATTSTSAGAPPRPATARSSCRRPSSSTPRPPTAASGVRRSPAGTPTTRSAAPPSTRCWPTPPAGRCRGRSSGSAFGTAAADARLPAGPAGRAGARRARRAGLGLLQPARAARAPGATRRGRPGRRPRPRSGTAAGAVVAALPARARLRQRPARGRHQPGRRRRRAPARRRSWPSPASRAACPWTRTTRSAQDTGLVVRFFTNPVAVSLTLFVVLALVGARDGVRHGRPAARCRRCPSQASDWWRLHAESWHPLGQGTAVPAPAYVLPAGAAATLLGGSPGTAISALLVLAVPFSLWGAWRFLRVVGRLVDRRGFAKPLLAWGAVDLRPDPGRQRRVGRGPASASSP